LTALVVEIEKKMDACETDGSADCCKLITKIGLPTVKFRERTRMIQLSNRIRRMQMKWSGRILRMSDNKTVKKVFSWEPSSRRSRGRPKKRWMDCVEEYLHRAESINQSINQSINRSINHSTLVKRHKS